MEAYVALVSLMNNLEQIQRHTHFPISPDKEQMESLHERVNFLIDFLESCNSHGDREQVQGLESRVTDAAHAAEDIIETHIVDSIIAHFRCKQNKGMKKIIANAKCILPKWNNEMITRSTRLLGVEKVLEDMDFIKEEAMKIEDKSGNEHGSSITAAPPSSSIPAGNNIMVGMDDELNRITELLIGRQRRSRQIIPIVGMGGMGKTTLAKTAFEKPFIVKHFDFCAWVSISQEYDLKKILLGLLPNDESDEMSENELKERLHKSLYGRRYLVVLDDMWSVEAWEMVKLFLPDNNNGSRIIVTTRVSSVATHLDSCSLEMNFLNEDKSWNLLCEKVFGQEGCPPELEEVGRKIAKNCKGLPLSIVVIGGLLAKSEQTKEYWENIARDTKAIISLEGDELCMKILSLSYHNLPIHLKPCFLYMGVCSEDKEIHVSWLIKLWVAEGFLKPNSSKELESVGEECLNDLISRNLILVHRRGLGGKIKSCMIHDLLRDLCLKEAHKGKFLYAPKMQSQYEVQGIGSQCCNSIPRSLYIPKHLDTRKSGFLGRSLMCYVPKVILKNFRLLRVLIGSDKRKYDHVKYLLDDTFQLVNARFIAIDTMKLPKFPSSFCLLWNLQILIVRGNREGLVVPSEIWEMTELRHLQFERRINLPDPPSEQMNRRGDAVMKNLHTLMWIADFRLSDEVVKRIPNIKKLKISHGIIYNVKKLEEYDLKNLGLLEKLESLAWGCALSMSDVLLNLAIPSSLKKLTLARCGLRWEDMTIIGSLPRLEVLKLYYGTFKGPEWVTNEGEFPCLKYLEIRRCNDLVNWIADSTDFPCLERLVLYDVNKLVEIPSGIGEIPTLQSIMVNFCSNSAVISAKKILDEQEELDNVGLRVRVKCYKRNYAELKNLASDNFLVDARDIDSDSDSDSDEEQVSKPTRS